MCLRSELRINRMVGTRKLVVFEQYPGNGNLWILDFYISQETIFFKYNSRDSWEIQKIVFACVLF